MASVRVIGSVLALVLARTLLCVELCMPVRPCTTGAVWAFRSSTSGGAVLTGVAPRWYPAAGNRMTTGSSPCSGLPCGVWGWGQVPWVIWGVT